MIFLIQQINRMKMENDTVLNHKDKYWMFSKQNLNILHSTALPPELPSRVINCFETIIWSISNLNESKNIPMAFDTNSVQIAEDNRTSNSMSNNEDDFIGPIKPLCNHYIKGV